MAVVSSDEDLFTGSTSTTTSSNDNVKVTSTTTADGTQIKVHVDNGEEKRSTSDKTLDSNTTNTTSYSSSDATNNTTSSSEKSSTISNETFTEVNISDDAGTLDISDHDINFDISNIDTSTTNNNNTTSYSDTDVSSDIYSSDKVESLKNLFVEYKQKKQEILNAIEQVKSFPSSLNNTYSWIADNMNTYWDVSTDEYRNKLIYYLNKASSASLKIENEKDNVIVAAYAYIEKIDSEIASIQAELNSMV